MPASAKKLGWARYVFALFNRVVLIPATGITYTKLFLFGDSD